MVAPATENGTLPHVGYLNHAYSQMSVPTHSRPGSVLDLNFDKISHKSSRWGDDDDLPDWDPHVPNDSGLHSLAVSSSHLKLVLSNCKKKKKKYQGVTNPFNGLLMTVT